MKAPSSWPASKVQLRVILSIVFFGFLGLSMPYLIFPVLFLNPSYAILPIESETARGVYLGLTLAAYPFGQFLGSPILGALSDEYGRRDLVFASLLAASLFSMLTVVALIWQHVWMLIASRFLAGLMEGNIAIARAMAADLKTLNKHDTFGKINAAASIAYIIGPLAGGLLADSTIHESFGITTPFWVMSLLYMALAGLSYATLTAKLGALAAHSRTVWQRINFVERLRRLFRNRQLKMLLIVVTIHTLAVDIFYEFGPVYLTALWMFTPSTLALYNGALSLALAIGNIYVIGVLANRFENRPIVKWSMVGVAGCLLCIVMIPSPAVILALFTAIGFAIAISNTNLTVQVSDSAPDNIQGEVMGVQTSLRVLGDAIICVIGGVSLALEPGLILLIACGISVIALASYLWHTNPAQSGFSTGVNE